MANPFMKSLGEAWRCGNLYRTARFEALGIGSYQDSYILNICRNPGIAQDALTGLIYVHKSNVARQLASLEEKGFITRSPDPKDRRSLLVYPTQKALDAIPAIREVHRTWNELVLNGFSEEERERIAQIAQRLADNAKRVIADEHAQE